MNIASFFQYLISSPAIVSITGLLLGLVWVAVLAVEEFGAWLLVTPRRPLELPADDPYPGEPIHLVAHDGLKFAGTWHSHPEANGRTLLLLHGLAEQRHTMRTRADAIYAHGWNVAVLDSRAYGDSQGSFASFGGHEVADLRAWIAGLAPRFEPSAHLAVWGRSMGAGVALRTAAEDSRIKALVLEAPYNDLHQTAAILLKRYRIPASKLFASRVLKRAKRLTGVSLHKPRPIDAATRVKIPTLIIRGTHDALVSANETKYLASQLNGLVENIEIEGARHSKVLDVGGPALIEQIGEFLDRTSNSR